MKKISLFLLVSGICLAQACSTGTNKTDDSVDSAKDVNAEKDTSSGMLNNNDTSTAKMAVSKDASDFAVEAAAGGMMEVELGQIAQQKATNPRVKNFAQMMVTDHTAANDELKKLAASKNITLPTTMGEDEQDKIDKLNKKTGKDFDQDYMDMMVKDHKNDIDKFEKAGNNLDDPDLKNFAMKALPTLQKHLDSAKAITGKK